MIERFAWRQMDVDGGGARSVRCSAARTARRSRWDHSDVFSDEEGDGDARTRGGATAPTAGAASRAGGKSRAVSAKSRVGGKDAGKRLPGHGRDTLDLLAAGEVLFPYITGFEFMMSTRSFKH